MQISEKTPLKTEISKLAIFLQSFYELSHSDLDLFFLFGIAFLETVGVLMLTTGLSLYLSEIKQLSDMLTGIIIAGYGLSGFIYSIFMGSLIDRYGLKRCMSGGNFLALVGLVLFTLFENTCLQIITLFTLISIGANIVLPCLKIGIKFYTNEDAKSLGFSMLYLIIFGGGAVAGIFIDIALTFGGRDAETFKKIFFIGVCLLSVSLTLTYFIRDIKDNIMQDPWEITKEVLKDKLFWKLIVLTLLLVIVKSLFSHMSITLPIYMHRDIEPGAHFGIMLAVHKGIMVIFTPLLTGLVYYTSCYNLLIIGSLVSVCGVIPLLFGSSYFTVILFVIIVSIGESIYAPRLIDYILSIAPRGKEGTYVAVASAPLMLGTIIAGLLGGVLLGEYCPSVGPKNCNYMWGIIGIIILFVPFLMMLFRNHLEEKPKDIIKLV